MNTNTTNPFNNTSTYHYLLDSYYCRACRRIHTSQQLIYLRTLFHSTIYLQWNTPLSDTEAHMRFANSIFNILLRIQNILDSPNCTAPEIN